MLGTLGQESHINALLNKLENIGPREITFRVKDLLSYPNRTSIRDNQCTGLNGLGTPQSLPSKKFPVPYSPFLLTYLLLLEVRPVTVSVVCLLWF